MGRGRGETEGWKRGRQGKGKKELDNDLFLFSPVRSYDSYNLEEPGGTFNYPFYPPPNRRLLYEPPSPPWRDREILQMTVRTRR